MSRTQLVDFEMNEINLIEMDGTVFDKVHDQLPILS